MSHTPVSIELDYGYVDLEDAENENDQIVRYLRNTGTDITTTVRVNSADMDRVYIRLTTPYRSDLVRYVSRYLGSNYAMAASIVEERLRRDS